MDKQRATGMSLLSGRVAYMKEAQGKTMKELFFYVIICGSFEKICGVLSARFNQSHQDTRLIRSKLSIDCVHLNVYTSMRQELNAQE